MLDESKILYTTGWMICHLQVSPSQFSELVKACELEPAMQINGVSYYDERLLNRLQGFVADLRDLKKKVSSS